MKKKKQTFYELTNLGVKENDKPRLVSEIIENIRLEFVKC